MSTVLLRTLSWNIGGGKLLAPGADPSKMASYNREGIDTVADIIKRSGADVVALQEAQRSGDYCQVEVIASLAGYSYFSFDEVSESHIDKGYRLGNGILSKHPLVDAHIGFYTNPMVSVEWEDGSIATSFDKAYSRYRIDMQRCSITLINLHLIPFRKFGISLDSSLAKEILDDVALSLDVKSDTLPLVIMGDFNINDSTLASYLPSIFADGRLEEVVIDTPTTPKHRRYDHVLYKGLGFISKKIDSSVLTDHYPVMCDFEMVDG